jgi:hypothetical protein
MSAPRMPRAMAQPMPVGLGRGAAPVDAGCGSVRLAGCGRAGLAAVARQCGGHAVGDEGCGVVAPPSAAVLERGAYLVRVGACMGCHTAQGGVVLAGEARCARRLACSMRRI